MVQVQMVVVVGLRLKLLALVLRAVRRWRGVPESPGYMFLLGVGKVTRHPFARVVGGRVGMVRLVGWGWMLMVPERSGCCRSLLGRVESPVRQRRLASRRVVVRAQCPVRRSCGRDPSLRCQRRDLTSRAFLPVLRARKGSSHRLCLPASRYCLSDLRPSPPPPDQAVRRPLRDHWVLCFPNVMRRRFVVHPPL